MTEIKPNIQKPIKYLRVKITSINADKVEKEDAERLLSHYADHVNGVYSYKKNNHRLEYVEETKRIHFRKRKQLNKK